MIIKNYGIEKTTVQIIDNVSDVYKTMGKWEGGMSVTLHYHTNQETDYKEISVNNIAYICNDNGKTIEVILYDEQ